MPAEARIAVTGQAAAASAPTAGAEVGGTYPCPSATVQQVPHASSTHKYPHNKGITEKIVWLEILRLKMAKSSGQLCP